MVMVSIHCTSSLTQPCGITQGYPHCPSALVLIKDSLGKFEPQALLCTDLSAQPMQMLQWFRQRWQVEVTFEEVRSHLGVLHNASGLN